MSGFAGIVGPACSEAERRWLGQATALLGFRGPDARCTWHDEAAALGHTLLVTAPEEQGSTQPVSLDREVWLTGDIRFDGREDLARRLRSAGREATAARPDAELALLAYDVWGERCAEHLAGDFAFAIWNRRTRRLFCARDQFGVGQFFYAVAGEHLLFSNTLDALLLHPGVSAALDEAALGDYLVSGWVADAAATSFAAIRRLPPAHRLCRSGDRLEVDRYWTVPDPEPLIRYPRPGDYAEHFLGLLTESVADRVRTDRLSVQLSGGMDSSSIAAVAHRVLTATGNPFSLHAVTIDFSGLMPDREAGYAREIAARLGIEAQVFDASSYELADPHEVPVALAAEPHPFMQGEMARDLAVATARQARVAFTGSGGDPLLALSSGYWITWLARGQIGRLWSHLRHHRRLFQRFPRPRLRAAWREHRRRRASAGGYGLAQWLEPGFVERTKLQERQRNIWRAATTQADAVGMAESPQWTSLFLWSDPAFTRVPLRFRHPFFDIRLVRYVRSVPPMPWLFDKRLLREAMRDLLPASVIDRPKTILARLPTEAMARRRGPSPAWLDFVSEHQDLERFLSRDKLRAGLESAASAGRVANVNLGHTLSLALWLYHWRRPQPKPYLLGEERAADAHLQVVVC